MNEQLTALIELMKALAKEINGYYFQNTILKQIGVIKDDSIFLYQFVGRDVPAAFSVMTSMSKLEDVEIYMDRPNMINLKKPYYKDEIFDVSIYKTNESYGKALVDNLLSDFEFMANFKKLFKSSYKIAISKQTISITYYRPVVSTFATLGTMSKEELIQMWNITKEIQKSTDYFIRKYNPIL